MRLKLATQLFMAGATLSLGLMSCSSGGGSGSTAATPKGTGFLRVQIPQIDLVETSFMKAQKQDIKSKSVVTFLLSTYSPGHSIATLGQYTRNENDGVECAGALTSIPFIVCLVESLGINAVGTYSGEFNNRSFVATVSETTEGDFDIQASVTKDSVEVFRYKANSEGTVGEVFAVMHGLVDYDTSGVDTLTEEAILISWDSRVAEASTVKVSSEYYGDYLSGTTVTRGLKYLSAIFDQTANTADVVLKNYTHNVLASYDPDESVAEMHMMQGRIKDGVMLETTMACLDDTTPDASTSCWDPADLALHYFTEQDTKNVIGGSFDFTNGMTVTGSANFSVPTCDDTDDCALTGGSPFSNTSLDAVYNSSVNGVAYSVELDKNDATSGSTALSGLVHEVKSMSYATLNAILAGR